MSNISTDNLWLLKRDEQCQIVGFDSQLDSAIKARIDELGFRVGARVICTQAPRLGAPKLYRVGNAVYSLEKPVAMMVQIQRIES
jgi:Fe2+ transport system protein FeoA